jgi:2-octaprenyl-6-methoxyphenol hydroxylase
MRLDVSAEVSILGAGPVGCTLALLVQQQGRSVALVQHRREARAPFRPIALSHASRLILERAGAWGMLAPTPIACIHVSQQGGFGRTRMSAADAGVPALGYVVDYGALLGVLLALASERNIPIRAEPAESLLAVHAEGTSEENARKDYGQEAVVAQVTMRPGALATAWERFTPDGPLALLPLDGRYGAIWGARPERARELCELPEAGFLAALSQAFGRRAARSSPPARAAACRSRCACARRASLNARRSSAMPRRRCTRSPDRA